MSSNPRLTVDTSTCNVPSSYGAGKAGVSKSIIGPLRRGGRLVAPAVILVDGVHDWYLLVDCALDCKGNSCE